MPGREGEHLQMVETVPYRPQDTDDAPGRPSRIGPNGATWADPAGRHPGVDPGDTRRLSRNDPRHPDNADPDRASNPEPPRKLWHSSGGSAGR